MAADARGDYQGVAREGVQATLLQGQPSACMQHPCCSMPCLARLHGVLELVEEVGAPRLPLKDYCGLVLSIWTVWAFSQLPGILNVPKF